MRGRKKKKYWNNSHFSHHQHKHFSHHPHNKHFPHHQPFNPQFAQQSNQHYKKPSIFTKIYRSVFQVRSFKDAIHKIVSSGKAILFFIIAFIPIFMIIGGITTILFLSIFGAGLGATIGVILGFIFSVVVDFVITMYAYYTLRERGFADSHVKVSGKDW